MESLSTPFWSGENETLYKKMVEFYAKTTMGGDALWWNKNTMVTVLVVNGV